MTSEPADGAEANGGGSESESQPTATGTKSQPAATGSEGGDGRDADPRLDNRVGGVALLLGYFLFLAVLYRNPEQGVEAATAGAGTLLLFVVAPVAGVACGVYAAAEGAGAGLALFVAGNYLAVAAVAVALFLPAAGPLVSLAGLALFALAVVALLAGLRAGFAYLRVEPGGAEP